MPLQSRAALALHEAVDTILSCLSAEEQRKVHEAIDACEADGLLRSHQDDDAPRLTSSKHEAVEDIMRPVQRSSHVVKPTASTLAYLRAESEFLRQQPRETLAVFCLDRHGEVCHAMRFQGDQKSCDVPLQRIIKEAVAHQARGVLLLHNHPSHQFAQPSPEDDRVAIVLSEALAAKGIRLADSLIVVRSGHTHSFREAAAAPTSLWDTRQAAAESEPHWLQQVRRRAGMR